MQWLSSDPANSDGWTSTAASPYLRPEILRQISEVSEDGLAQVDSHEMLGEVVSSRGL